MTKSWASDAALASRGVIVCAALGLGACGGGGGGGSNVKPTPPPPVVDTSPMVVSTDLAVASGQTITRPVVLDAGADLDNQGTIGGNVDIGVEAKAPSIVTNHNGGSIRGTKTAIQLDHGGEIHNSAGSTIQATGVGGNCGAAIGCAISAGLDEQLQPWEVDFKLVNEGTIIGNVNMASNGFNWVRLLPGGVVQGDLDFGSNGYASILELDGTAGTMQRYSAAVTGNALFVSSLTKSGDGTWIIDKDIAPGQVTVDGGTLQIGDGGTTGSMGNSVGFNIFNGRIVFDRSDDLVISSSFIGTHGVPGESSTLVQAGSGVLTLTNDNTLIRPDFIVIENGTLQLYDTGNLTPESGNIPLMAQVTNNASLVFNSNMRIFQNGSISGAGSVTQNGSGSLIFNAENTYSGGTTVNKGALLAVNPLPGNVIVGADGKLGGYSPFFDDSVGMAGVIGNLSNHGATLVAGGDATVGGNYAQSATGTLAIRLGSKLDVTGTATLGGGTLEVTGADAGYIANTHTEVLAAQGGVVGTFDRLAKSAGVVFTSSTINYAANSVWLETTGLNITQAAVGEGIGYTPASTNAAGRVQGAFEQLNDRIATDSLAGVSDDFLHAAGQFQRAPSIAAAQASLRSLSGQLHAASAAMTFRAIDAGNQALSDRIDGVRAGNASVGMWTQQLAGNGSMARDGFDGVGFQLNGWLVGNDYRIGRNAVAGFAFGQGVGVQQLEHGLDRDDSRRSEGMVYAGIAGDRWYTQGRVGFGHLRQRVDRELLLGPAAAGVWTRYDGRYQAVYGESGLRFGAGGLRLTPFASVEYARSDRGGFVEEGAGGFGLRSDAQALSRWQASLGLRAARRWDFGHGRMLDLGAHAQWRRALGMRGDDMDASFVGLQQWSPLAGIGLSRYGGLFGVGMAAQLSPRAALKLSYDYERGEHESARGLTAAVNVAF